MSDKQHCDSEHRKYLRDSQFQYYRDFDKYLITLASGSLVLSIAFIDSIASNPADCVVLLHLSWTGFVLAILGILVSVHLTAELFQQHIILHDAETGDSDSRVNDRANAKSGDLQLLIGVLNVATLAVFALGVILMFLFAIINS